MKIEFNTNTYAYEHGKQPRGYGHWLFTFEGYEFWAHGTYSEAKKSCREYVKVCAPSQYIGTVEVNVEP